MSKTDPLEQRKKLSFEQAEGLAPMPSQLERGKIRLNFERCFGRTSGKCSKGIATTRPPALSFYKNPGRRS